ncbi:hypothetical protein Bpfe_005421 [Biomphalaria pfeifferi]|uniref:Uncharacterized protein n=1 Tax=Biomphalaria pfeifferi TaxID=112525 RepID=A0AAD8C381_BIOPF|nr:hypothetical protein Bpfe_005421 [Biomphalaria pfeifferi]
MSSIRESVSTAPRNTTAPRRHSCSKKTQLLQEDATASKCHNCYKMSQLLQNVSVEGCHHCTRKYHRWKMSRPL